MISGKQPRWELIGASRRGASHQRKGTANQDAWGRWESACGARLIAVADGHGSPRAMRSHLGARQAIHTVREVVSQWLEDGGVEGEGGALSRLPATILGSWRKKIAADLLVNPLQAHELEKLETAARAEVLLDPIQAYGTTLLVVVVQEEELIIIAIGDGEVLGVGPAGSQALLLDDERFIANETTSLSMKAAESEFQVRSLAWRSEEIEMVLVCTDGVSNAFRSREGFQKLGGDLLEQLRERGKEEVEVDLPGWLDDFSKEGSGDDVTLAMMVLTSGPPGEAKEAEIGAAVDVLLCSQSGRPMATLEVDEEEATEPVVRPWFKRMIPWFSLREDGSIERGE